MNEDTTSVTFGCMRSLKALLFVPLLLGTGIAVAYLLSTTNDDAKQQEENQKKYGAIWSKINQLDKEDPKESGDVASDLAKMGIAAIPALSQALQDKREQVRFGAAWALGMMRPLPKDALDALHSAATKDSSDEVRKRAFETLLHWDPLPTKVANSLVELVADDNAASHLRFFAACKIRDAEIETPQAIAALGRALKDRDEMTRWKAAEVLAELGPEAKSAGADLEPGLRDTSANVWSQTTRALARFDRHRRSRAVSVLIEKLKDGYWLNRSIATGALAEIGPAAEPAIPVLIELLKDQRTIRAHAAEALGSIGPAARSAIPALIAEINGPDQPNDDCKYEAFFALRRIAPDDQQVATSAISGMISYLQNSGRPDWRRRDVAYLLGRYGAKAKIALPALEKASKNSPPTTRIAAADAYVRLGGDPKEVIPMLMKLLDHPDVRGSDYFPDTQGDAAEVLGEFGAASKVAVPMLLKWLKVKDGDRAEPRQVALALGRIDPEGHLNAAMEVLSEEAKGPYGKGAEKAAKALGVLGSKAVPALVEMLKDDRRGRKRAAATALGTIGPFAKDAIPALKTAFADQRPSVRRAILEACGKIGPNLCLDILAAGVKDASWSVREKAVITLGLCDLSAKEVKALLEQAAKDQDEDVRDAAKKLLTRGSRD